MDEVLDPLTSDCSSVKQGSPLECHRASVFQRRFCSIYLFYVGRNAFLYLTSLAGSSFPVSGSITVARLTQRDTVFPSPSSPYLVDAIEYSLTYRRRFMGGGFQASVEKSLVTETGDPQLAEQNAAFRMLLKCEVHVSPSHEILADSHSTSWRSGVVRPSATLPQ